MLKSCILHRRRFDIAKMRKRLANSVSLLGRKDGRLPLLSVVCLSVHLLSELLTWNQPRHAMEKETTSGLCLAQASLNPLK